MSTPETELRHRAVKRCDDLAAMVRRGRFNDNQVRYLHATLDHFHQAAQEMTIDD